MNMWMTYPLLVLKLLIAKVENDGAIFVIQETFAPNDFFALVQSSNMSLHAVVK